jgi:Na+-translocating ferredoxin:NAD+ oxidoreductase RnfC subunit
MENKHLIDLSIKYDLNSTEVSKLIDIIYQAGVSEMESPNFKRIATYICETKLLETPIEEVIEELKRKGLITEGN